MTSNKTAIDLNVLYRYIEHLQAVVCGGCGHCVHPDERDIAWHMPNRYCFNDAVKNEDRHRIFLKKLPLCSVEELKARTPDTLVAAVPKVPALSVEHAFFCRNCGFVIIDVQAGDPHADRRYHASEKERWQHTQVCPKLHRKPGAEEVSSDPHCLKHWIKTGVQSFLRPEQFKQYFRVSNIKGHANSTVWGAYKAVPIFGKASDPRLRGRDVLRTRLRSRSVTVKPEEGMDYSQGTLKGYGPTGWREATDKMKGRAEELAQKGREEAQKAREEARRRRDEEARRAEEEYRREQERAKQRREERARQAELIYKREEERARRHLEADLKFAEEKRRREHEERLEGYRRAEEEAKLAEVAYQDERKWRAREKAKRLLEEREKQAGAHGHNRVAQASFSSPRASSVGARSSPMSEGELPRIKRIKRASGQLNDGDSRSRTRTRTPGSRLEDTKPIKIVIDSDEEEEKRPLGVEADSDSDFDYYAAKPKPKPTSGNLGPAVKQEQPSFVDQHETLPHPEANADPTPPGVAGNTLYIKRERPTEIMQGNSSTPLAYQENQTGTSVNIKREDLPIVFKSEDLAVAIKREDAPDIESTTATSSDANQPPWHIPPPAAEIGSSEMATLLANQPVGKPIPVEHMMGSYQGPSMEPGVNPSDVNGHAVSTEIDLYSLASPLLGSLGSDLVAELSEYLDLAESACNPEERHFALQMFEQLVFSLPDFPAASKHTTGVKIYLMQKRRKAEKEKHSSLEAAASSEHWKHVLDKYKQGFNQRELG
jgi:hypothetical protein